MIFKKDNFKLGLLLGSIAPLLGMFFLKTYKLSVFSMKEIWQFLTLEPGYKTLTAALSVSLLMNAALFTLYINQRKDQTAKGIFVTTLIYGLIILSIKTFT